MRKPGPKAVPLSQLILWESLWYGVFLGLRGREPNALEKSVRKETAILLKQELEDLKKSLGESRADRDPAKHRQDERQVLRLAGQMKLEASFVTDRELAEPEVWKVLVNAKTANQVRKACSQSERWLDPSWRGRPYVRLLQESANGFVRAKRDRFYARSLRPSSDKSRVVFFARVMAGIACGIAPSTAVDRLRKVRHGDDCPCVHCDVRRQNRIYEALYGDLLFE